MSLIKQTFTAAAIVVSLGTLAAKPSQAVSIDFSSWNSTGNVSNVGNGQVNLETSNGTLGNRPLQSFVGVNPTDLDIGGEAFQGSVVTNNITVAAGDKLNFSYNFLTDETTTQAPFTPLNDFAFVSIDGAVQKLADFNDAINASTSFDSETGLTNFSRTFANAGTFQVGLGVVGVDDFNNPSALQITNAEIEPVPEPLTILGTLVAGGFGTMFRRKRSKK